MKLILGLVFAVVCYGQTLGQFRLVDFSPRTDAVVVSNSSGLLTITPGTFTITTGDCVYIFTPYTIAQDKALAITHGNLGKGYFCLNVIDSTHWQIDHEMYSNTASTGNGTTTGDYIVPLHTYYLRSGPRVALDGPVDKGSWNSVTNYRALEMVQAPDTNYYVAIQDNNNKLPPNATYWRIVDHSKVGPGTYTAKMRSAAVTSSFSFGEVKLLEDTYWGVNSRFDYDKGTDEGEGGNLAAWYWLSSGDNTYLPKAQTLATQAEDLAMGTVGCDPTDPQRWCGRGSDIDYARTFTGVSAWSESVIDWTLTDAQRQTFANKVLNSPDTSHNGPDTTSCTPTPLISAGTDSSIQISCGATPYICNSVSGTTHFLSMPNFGPGSIVVGIPYTLNPDHTGGVQEAIGRVKTVVSDTQFEFEYASSQFSRAAYPKVTGSTHYPVILGYNTGTTLNGLLGANAPWTYTAPWNDAAHNCGVRWYTEHHGSGPSEIPGQESHYPADYGFINSDFARINNRTLTALPAQVAWGLSTADFDIRGVNLVEQSVNYYMTQWMAQNIKSRWAAFGGHGNQYGPGRVWWFAAEIAQMLVNSLTVTPPGILTGNYLTNLNRMENYAAWNSWPQALHSYETGYTWAFNSDLLGGMQAAIQGQQSMITSLLYPSDISSKWTWDYWFTRRGDYGCLSGCGAGGWIAFAWQPYGLAVFDPTATRVSVTTNTTQQAVFKSDQDECIAAGLYCLVDAPHGAVFSSSGWSNTDSQLMMQAVSSYICCDDVENYSPGGALTVLQNQPSKHANVLLGGVGLYPMTALSSQGGQWDSSVPMIYDATTGGLDKIPPYSTANYLNDNIDRWGGPYPDGPSNSAYMYARVNYAPLVRQASDDYTTPIAKSWYSVPGNVTREVLHLKNGSNNPHYIVVYDAFQSVQAGNQLRDYWHLIDEADLASNFAIARHPEWVTTDYTNKAVSLITPSSGRLNIKSFDVPGSSNPHVAMLDENYNPPFFSGFYKQDYAINTTTVPTWSSGVATVVVAGQPWNNFPLPVGTAVQIRGINSAGPGSFNGTFNITSYTPGGNPTITYALATDPGAYVSRVVETNVSFDGWCNWVSTWNPTASCAGNYNRAASKSYMPGMVWPGTYRVTSCASTDGTSCDNETNGEILSVLQPSASAATTLPAFNQPTCTGTGGNCLAIEIKDSTFPDVAIMSRNGTLLTGMSVTTTHAGTANYGVTGLAAGTYNVSRGGTTIATRTVNSGDGTLQFSSTSGLIAITSTGTIGLLVVSPNHLDFTCSSAGVPSGSQNVSISGSGVVLDNWSATKSQSWLTLTPSSGVAAGTMGVSVTCPGAGTYSDTISISSTTVGITNSPQTVTVSLLQYSAPSITTTSPLPNGTVGQPYNQTLVGTGGLAPYAWSIISGSLTACNLSMTPTGNITGTPSVATVCNFTVQLADSQTVPATVSKAFQITVNSGVTPISLDASPLTFNMSCLNGGFAIPQLITFTSVGGTLDNWSTNVTSGASWLFATPSSGTVATNFNVGANCSTLTPGLYSGTIELSSTTAGVNNSPQVINVSLTVNFVAAPSSTYVGGKAVKNH